MRLRGRGVREGWQGLNEKRKVKERRRRRREGSEGRLSEWRGRVEAIRWIDEKSE